MTYSTKYFPVTSLKATRRLTPAMHVRGLSDSMFCILKFKTPLNHPDPTRFCAVPKAVLWLSLCPNIMLEYVYDGE